MPTNGGGGWERGGPTAVSAPDPSAPAAAPPEHGDDLPGTERTVNTRQLHANLSGEAYDLLRAAKAANPDRTFGDLITEALRAARSTLVAEGATADEDDDPLAPPRRARRLRVADSRHRSFSVTHGQAAAIVALAGEVGIPNLSELFERAVLLAYGPNRGLLYSDEPKV